MDYVNIAERTTAGLNAAADINQLQENINVVYGKVISDILNEIEMMQIKPTFCDPLNIPDNYLIADGSIFPAGSEAVVIHNTGGTILSGTPFEATYLAKGLTHIPNVLGQHLRYAPLGSVNDPDRDDRRQAVTGTVDSTSGVLIYLPAFYINIIKNTFDNSRPVIIGEAPATIFSALTVYGTVSTINTALGYVVLTSITGIFTAGSAKSLIIKGDIVGSFQMDQFESHWHITYFYPNYITTQAGAWYFDAVYNNPADSIHTDPRAHNPISDGVYPLRTGAETRPKNIALLPLVRVYL